MAQVHVHVVRMLGRIAGPAETRPFEFLRRVAPERIASIIRGESHQTIALILANLPATLAAGVLTKLGLQRRTQAALLAQRALLLHGIAEADGLDEPLNPARRP